jgi:hypothetical protein
VIETKIGNIKVATRSKVKRGKVIALFAAENCGKTRFCLTGKGKIGCVPLEMKAYPTLEKDAIEMGKDIIVPEDPFELIVQMRKVSAMDSEHKQQLFYMEHVKKVQEYTYSLLETKDVNTVMIDKFTTYCIWQEYATNGMQEKYIKVEGKVFKARGELNQTISDFLNSLSQFGKTVILTNATKDDYDVLGSDGKPMRQTWESFRYLGSHVNLVCELVDNKYWDPNKKANETQLAKHGWHYGLNIRRCQDDNMMEGPQGQMLLTDDQISLPNLIVAVDKNADIEQYI